MSSSIQQNAIVLDASGGIVGRIASFAAKQALYGKNVAIVNCSKALITGRPRTTINIYNAHRRRGGSSLNGPFFPKHPERIMKRTVRGMLPHLQQRGIDALKRVRCYEDTPQEFAQVKMLSFHRSIKSKTINLLDLAKEI